MSRHFSHAFRFILTDGKVHHVPYPCGDAAFRGKHVHLTCAAKVLARRASHGALGGGPPIEDGDFLLHTRPESGSIAFQPGVARALAGRLAKRVRSAIDRGLPTAHHDVLEVVTVFMGENIRPVSDRRVKGDEGWVSRAGEIALICWLPVRIPDVDRRNVIGAEKGRGGLPDIAEVVPPVPTPSS